MYMTFSPERHRYEAFFIMFRRVEVAKRRLWIHNVVGRGLKLVGVGFVGCVVIVARVRRPKAV